MITTILEIVLIAILAIGAVIGLVSLGMWSRKKRLNPDPEAKNHDYELLDVEPQKIHQLFNYKKK